MSTQAQKISKKFNNIKAGLSKVTTTTTTTCHHGLSGHIQENKECKSFHESDKSNYVGQPFNGLEGEKVP